MAEFLVGAYEGAIFKTIGSTYKNGKEAIAASERFAEFHQEEFVVLKVDNVYTAKADSGHRIGLVSGVVHE